MTAVLHTSRCGASALRPHHYVPDSRVKGLLTPGAQVVSAVRPTADSTDHPHTAHIVFTPLRGNEALNIEASFLTAAAVGSGHHHSVARGLRAAFTGVDDGQVRGQG